jgi:lipid-binding SYLF domain-containing protein
MIGALYGDGVLFHGQKAEAFYNIAAVSYGYQAGAQEYSYAMFFMNDAALQYLDKSDGFEIGTGPSVVVVDQGVAGALSTSTLRDDVYAFIFGQTGLMAGLGLQGSKITRIDR